MNKKSRVFGLFFLFIVFSFYGFFVLENSKDAGLSNGSVENSVWKNESVKSKIVVFFVRGSSMEGLYNEGDEVRVDMDYYKDRDVGRNDVVVINFTPRNILLIKQVKGVPGDKFEIKYDSDVWKVYVNGDVLRNSEGKEYVFDNRSVSMLLLYSKDYGVIPNDTYLVLGNKVYGSFDSSRFGFVSRESVLGKVLN